LNPLILHVTTNGVLTERIVRFCENRPRDAHLYLLVSLDGIGETHNAIRGRRNVWERAVETIKAVAPRQKALRVQLGINQTIVNEAGMSDYGRLRDYLKPFGVCHNVVFGYDESATYHTAGEISIQHDSAADFNPFAQFDETRLQSFFSLIRKDLVTHSGLNGLTKRYYLNGIENRLLHRTGYPNPMCVALSSHMRLLPDGSLPTCQFNSTIVGNLRRQAFNQIWFSKAIAWQRTWVNQCRGCWAECEILPNALYTADLVGLMRRRSYNHNDFNPNPDKTEAKRKRMIAKARKIENAKKG
jgi:MoaA/NifB/PqqE/SkfB family radical SAM enzyme